MPNAKTADTLVAGACFTYQGGTYRLNTFMCEETSSAPECPMLAELFAEWEAEDAANVPEGMHRIKLRHCLPSEATYVSGSGVGGCVAAIDDIEFVGLVRWSPEELAEHHERALRKGREERHTVTIIRPIVKQAGA
jgi:hypothetical protein